MKLIHFPDAPNQKLGVQNDWVDRAYTMEPDKKIFFHFYAHFTLVIVI